MKVLTNRQLGHLVTEWDESRRSLHVHSHCFAKLFVEFDSSGAVEHNWDLKSTSNVMVSLFNTPGEWRDIIIYRYYAIRWISFKFVLIQLPLFWNIFFLDSWNAIGTDDIATILIISRKNVAIFADLIAQSLDVVLTHSEVFLHEISLDHDDLEWINEIMNELIN